MAQIIIKTPELNITPKIILRGSETFRPKSKGSAVSMSPISVLLRFEMLALITVRFH